MNRMVALKTMTTSVGDNPNLLERFYREAQSAGFLQHPNIVTIYNLGDEGGAPFIAMELVDGPNLDDLITRRSELPLPLKLVYSVQACRTFDYAHKRGIIHRDIKPGNVMVNKEGRVKVVDFGIARVLEASKTQTGTLIGTFSYMAPEVFHGEHASERSDIWSFGVLLYELLTYKQPFAGESPAATAGSRSGSRSRARSSHCDTAGAGCAAAHTLPARHSGPVPAPTPPPKTASRPASSARTDRPRTSPSHPPRNVGSAR